MFLSKVSSRFRTICLKINNQFGTNGLLLPKFIRTKVEVDRDINSSVCKKEDTTSSEKGIPDKLYKKVEIEVRGNDPKVLQSYTTFSVTAAAHLEIPLGQCIVPRKATHERLTLLKAVHVQKKHRVQYETRTYFRTFELLRLTGSTADTFLEYIQRNLPEGVAMKVTKVEIQRLPESIRPPVNS